MEVKRKQCATPGCRKRNYGWLLGPPSPLVVQPRLVMEARRLLLGVLLQLALDAVLANGGEEDCRAIEKEVREFYTKHNPKMLDKLDGILFRYKGQGPHA